MIDDVLNFLFLRLNPFSGLRRTHEHVFLDAEMDTEVLGYQISPKSRRESERFKSYSHANLQLWFATFRSIFTDPRC